MPQHAQSRMERLKLGCKSVEVMELGYGLPKFLHQGFQIFLSRLLAMKAKLIMKRFTAASDGLGESIVGFGLANPLACRSFHTRPFPSS